MNSFNFFLDFLFPKRCVSCRKLGSYICQDCTSAIRIIETSICPLCERPAIKGMTHPKCQTKYTIDGLTSFFSYQGPAKQAIKKLKFKPWLTDLTDTLVLLMDKAICKQSPTLINRLIKVKDSILVPVPLHWWRKRWRGFNQAEILGEKLAKRWGLDYIHDLLVRKKQTQPQFQLKGKQRKENVKGAFEVNKQYLVGSPKLPSNFGVILFDDVWTTGATLRTCASVLKRAGVKKVWGLTLARATLASKPLN